MALRFIGEAEVQSVLRWDQLIPVLKQALIDFSTGRIQQPVRSVLRITEHNGWFGLMPAILSDVMGAKLVTMYPSNTSRNLPTHLATIQLFDSVSGAPLALMDGRLITEMRTAAVSAIATDLLAPASARVLAFFGSGVQARSHLEALRSVRRFEEVRVWSRTPEHARRFAEDTGVIPIDSPERAVKGADVVVTVTGADEPVLRGRWLAPRAYVNAVGAVGPERRELDEEVMHGACVVVESREAALRESGDILLAGATIHFELGELLADPSKNIAHEGGRIVFKSLGIASEDIAAARLVWQALKTNSRS
jgi:ornithine cyclodeaminase/alanine dehydrogenase-like protein (mu-crystallin family)